VETLEVSNFSKSQLRKVVAEKVSILKACNSKFKILNSDLQKYTSENPNNKFDTVVLSSVLHEIPDPEHILKLIHDILEVKGTLFVVVPNNQSLHRLIGERMGIIKSLTDLTETEKLMQQSSSYSPQHLTNQLENHGFEVREVITSFIKPLPHATMQQGIDNSLFTEEDLEFLYKLSPLMPDFGSEIFGVAIK
jgi:trans-aconitate methyltransferase